MSWLTNFSLVMRSSITSLRETFEDPERMLHQLIIDMEEELDRVRASVAEAVADEIQVKTRSEREATEAETWQDRATAAIKRGDETTARAALERKVAAQQRADQLAQDHASQRTEVEKLQYSVRDLEDRIRQARQKKTLLTARMARASSTQKINSALERTHSRSAFGQFSRLEAKVEREEALSQAWDRMDAREHSDGELERQFEQQERAAQLESELEALKAQVTPE